VVNVYLTVVTPGASPVRTPPIDVIEPTDGDKLVHVPPPVPSDNVIVCPTQTAGDVGKMPNGFELTVTVFVVEHPVLVKVNVTRHVPPLTPVTIPEVLPTVSAVQEPLVLQVPVPGGISGNV